jgi:aminocarboxymuconate-semialdehyde decarboxylase
MSRAYHERLAALPGMVLKPDFFGMAYEQGGVRVVSCNEAWLDPDHCVRDMDARGIDFRLLSLSTPNLYIFPAREQAEIAKRVNDETLAAVNKRADRLRALPSLPLGDIEASLKELDRVGTAKDVAGLAIGSNVDGLPLSDPKFEPVWKRINELKLPVVEHPMHPPFGSQMNDNDLSLILGFWFDTQLMVTRLIQNGIFERYPDFPFLVAHTGSGIFTALNRLDRSSARTPSITPAKISKPFSAYAKNLYYDTCSFFAPALMEAHSIVGADHLMFGTDYPFVDAGPGHVETLDIDAKEKAKIVGDNAARVFKLN